MTIRKTDNVVFRASELAEQLDARSDSRLSPGLVAKRDLERYYHALDQARPRFSRSEALAILDVCNGVLWEPWSVTLLWASVSDTSDLGRKWQIDEIALVERLRRLSQIEALAVVDAAERFWAHQHEDADAALDATGLVAQGA